MKIEKKSVANIIPFGDVLEGVVFKDETGSLYLYDDADEVEVLENAILTY